MSVRDTILAAVRAGLGDHDIDPARVRREAFGLLDGITAARPMLTASSPVEAFAERVTSSKVAASLERIPRVEDFPLAVKRYLDANQLSHEVALQPSDALMALDWSGLATCIAPDAGRQVGIGIARWGIAETGSIVFHSDVETSILANFLPLHHLVLVRAHTIVPYLEDYATAALADGRKPPRNVNIITGASGTTDIEGTLVLGAHGPRYLHIVIAGEEAVGTT